MFGQYNPYGMRAMPQRPYPGFGAQYEQPIQNNAYPTSWLKGRIVTNVEEAKAAQIDLDGSSTFFPCPAEGKVYEKSIDLNGLPIFKVYELAKPQEQKQNDWADKAYVDSLENRVNKLEQMLGGVNNVKPNAINGNVAE